MFLSTPAARLLIVCLGLLYCGLFLFLAIASDDSMGWGCAGFGVVISVVGTAVALAEREEDERKERRLAELARSAPLEAIGEQLEATSRSLVLWSRGFAFAALVLAVLVGVGACPGAKGESGKALLSALAWAALALGAWFVNQRVSRIAAVLLLVVPMAELVAVGIAVARGHLMDRELVKAVGVPLVLAGVAAKCCVLTFKYRRLLWSRA